MRLLSACAISFAIVACSPYRQLSKNWDKIQKAIKDHPEWADSLKLVKHDTIHSVALRDTIIYVSNDPGQWDPTMFGQVDSVAEEVVKAPIKDKPKPTRRLQEIICPKAAKDTIYHLMLYNSEIKLYIPIRISIKSDGGKLSADIDAQAVKMPEPKTQTQVLIKPTNPIWKILALVFGGVLILLILIGLSRLIK